MKYTDEDRKALVRAVFPVIAGFKFTKSPAARDGSTKDVSADFAAAIWTRRYVDTLIDVLEKADERRDNSAAPTSSSGWPS